MKKKSLSCACIVQFQKISTPLKGLEFPKAGDSVTPKSSKKCMNSRTGAMKKLILTLFLFKMFTQEILNSKAEKMDS